MPAHCQSSPTGFPLFVVKNSCLFQGYLSQDTYLIHVYNDQVFYSKSAKALEQVAWRGGGCPIPEDIRGHNGPGSKQPDVDVSVPVHWRAVGLDDL